MGGQEKEWTGCLLDDLRAFGSKADQWTTVAQDEGEWRKTRSTIGGGGDVTNLSPLWEETARK